MCGKQKFFTCNHCGNMAGLINNEGVPMVCCGEKMSELVPNAAEAGAKNHLPVVAVSGDSVTVRVVSHPMEEGHFIRFAYVETERGGQRKCLKPSESAEVVFRFADDKPVAAYAYCNLHGLWKTEIEE